MTRTRLWPSGHSGNGHGSCRSHVARSQHQFGQQPDINIDEVSK